MRLKTLLPFAVSLGILLTLFTVYRMWLVPLLTSEIRSNVTPEQRSYWRVRKDIMAANARMRAIHIKDTVESVVPDSAGLFVVVPRGSTTAEEYLRRIYAREVAKGSTAAIGVMAVRAQFGGYVGFPERMFGKAFVPGNIRGLPYCVLVIPYFDPRPEPTEIAALKLRGGVGPCGWWAKYGGPGPKIEKWLLGGGSRFTQAEPSRHYDDHGFMPDGPASLFGRSNARRWFSVPGQACLAGRVEACTSAMTRADTSSSGYVMGDDDHYRPRLMSGEGVLLTDLEREFGAERFGAFWHSPEDVEPAFQAAFGISIGQWAHDWATKRAGPFVPARMDVLTIVLAIVFVGLFVGIGSAVANRRRL